MSQKTKRVSKSVEGSVITFSVMDANGNEQGPEWAVSVNVGDLPEEVRQKAMVEGIANRLHDGVKGDVEGPADVYEGIQSIADALAEGRWKRPRSTGTRVSIWAEAVARVKGVSAEEAAERLAEADDETLKSIKALDAVKRAKTEIEAERAKEKVSKYTDDDTGALDDLF